MKKTKYVVKFKFEDMNKKNKIQFNYNGNWFLVPKSVVKEYDNHGNPISTTIVINLTNTKLLLKQYITKKYPYLKVDLNSKQNHNGIHATVFYGRKDNKPIEDDEITQDVFYFAKSLQTGKWNPRFKSYMPDTTLPTTTSGTPIEFKCKYVFVNTIL